MTKALAVKPEDTIAVHDAKTLSGKVAAITPAELAAVVVIVGFIVGGAVFDPVHGVNYVGFGSATIAGLLAYSKSLKNGTELRDLRIEVNHRLTELVEARKAEARAAGRDEQRKESESLAVEVKAGAKTERHDLKEELKADAAAPVPVEVVNPPEIQKVEIVEKKGS